MEGRTVNYVPGTFFFHPPGADGEKQSLRSPHFHVFPYASCVDLTQLLLQPNAIIAGAPFESLRPVSTEGQKFEIPEDPKQT